MSVVLAGEFTQTQRRHETTFAAGEARVAAAADDHDLVIGRRGLLCVVVELARTTRWVTHDGGPRTDPTLTAAAQSFATALDESGPSARIRLPMIAAELAARADRLRRGLEHHDPPGWLAEVRHELRVRRGRSPGLAAMGRNAGVHPAHVARAFREHFGCSIGEWVRREQSVLACELLQHSSASIAEIADVAGFADQAHLTRRLRLHVGLTPAGLRRAQDATFHTFKTAMP